MKDVLKTIQQIQSEIFGKKTMYVDVHVFDDGATNIHVALFADINDSDDMKTFDFHSDAPIEKRDLLLNKLLAYVEYAKKI